MNEPWRASVLTLFPDMFPGVLGHSIAHKARERGIWDLSVLNMRDFSTSKHHSVDDTPYGGGSGMVMRPDVVYDALQMAHIQHARPNPRYIYFTPRGKVIKQSMVQEYADHKDGVILLCGRYEAIDERVIQVMKEEKDLTEISLGDFILSGGEIAAMTLLDACIRLLPDVLIKPDVIDCESFAPGLNPHLLEFSQYTKPRVWHNQSVPDVLLSGDHEKIKAWRNENARHITAERRPDLYACYQQSKSEKS